MSRSPLMAGVPTERRGTAADPAESPPPALATPVRTAIARTRRWLLGEQHPDGYWCAELEGDTILESETILLYAFLGREDDPLAAKAAAYILKQQLPEGGWAMYPGGRVEISGSVKAYFALKLAGHDPQSEPMRRAREAIRAHGGADAVNSFTRFYLALLGQISYDHCPAVPPEAILLPNWLPVNLYAVSSWSRTIIVPLSIVSAKRPRRQLAPERGIRELFLREPDDWPPLRCPGLPENPGLFSWDCFFRTVDRLLKACQRYGLTPLRRHAVARCERWMLKRFERSDGLGAIYPPIVWSILALGALEHDEDSPALRECHRQLEALVLEEPQKGSARLQPCKSPVWDTTIALRALIESGVRPESTAIDRAVRWLLSKQTDQPGDWSETVRAEPGGWFFEHHNQFYPDSDDTAMALMALRSCFDAPHPPCDALPPELRLVDESDRQRPEAAHIGTMRWTASAIDRGLRWMLAMQNRDGGWGAFDRNNDREFLCYVPFADHNAIIDPSTPDLTGRVLESLGRLGCRLGHPAVDRAVAYVCKQQEPDGAWFGRWGVNYIYGTWQAITGLVEVGVPAKDPAVEAGARWLLDHQQTCGGWGESPESYEDPTLRGRGRPTASQTAWAVLGLLAAGRHGDPAAARGIRFLTTTQNEDGTWDEPEFTGTGFPQVFYLRYHYYPIYFPLLALARWAVANRQHAEPKPQDGFPIRRRS